MTVRHDPARGPDGTTQPGSGQSAFVRVLDVQFWLMGRDAEHPDGNLLPRLGFTRQNVPDRPWPSRYRRAEAGGHVLIWQCGMFLQASEHGCLLLRGMTPAAVTDSQLNDLYDLAEVKAVLRRGSPCPPAALMLASQWFAHYEAAVVAAAGVGHRVPRPGPRPTLAPPEASSLEPEWRKLAVRLGKPGSRGHRAAGSGFPGVPDRVEDDVGDMVVGEGVLDLAGQAAGRDDAGGAQHPQVLGDQRLADPESGH